MLAPMATLCAVANKLPAATLAPMEDCIPAASEPVIRKKEMEFDRVWRCHVG